MPEEPLRDVAGIEDVPAELWLRAGDTLAGFVPSEGFNCTALRVRRGDHWEPVLAEPSSWEAVRARPAFHGSPLLAPYVYGLRDGLEYRGQRYTLKPGKAGRPAHGLTRDHPWAVTDQCQGENEATLRAHLTVGGGDPVSDARLAEFPFPLDIEVNYILRPRELTTRFVVTNLGTGTLPLGVGIHPYFALPMRAGGSTADLVARGHMARLTDDPRFGFTSGLGGYDERSASFVQRIDHYLALAPPESTILDLFERTDQPSVVEGAGEPFWSLSDEAIGLAVAIKASAAFRYVGQFVPADRSVLSPVVSTNRPNGFGLAARGSDGGMIELPGLERWRGWCSLAVRDLTS